MPSEPTMSHLAMSPSVTQGGPSAEITIFQGRANVTCEGMTTIEDIEITARFVPDANIRFTIPQPTRMISGDIEVLPQGADGPARGFATSYGFTFGQGACTHPAIGFVQSPLVFGSDARIGRLRFHLLNFSEYFGDRVSRQEEGLVHHWRGRVSFPMGPWTVTLDSLPESDKSLKAAKDVGGFVITHVGNLAMTETKHGIPKLFGFKKAQRALEVLYLVFGFANGARCQCFLPYGYRFMPTEVARWAHSWKQSRAAFNHTWFAWHKPSESFSFADPLYRLYEDEDERSWLWSAISLYLESNRNIAGVDIELAKSQIALELLAWEVCQERQILVSRDSFERLPAADKIRMALMWAGIPAAIPPTMKELARAMPLLSEGENLPHDGPLAVTQVRNSTIHATRARRKRMTKLDDLARYQAWMLSQNYVELLILRLLSYSGPFEPRYQVPGSGLYCPVPWAPGGDVWGKDRVTGVVGS